MITPAQIKAIVLAVIILIILSLITTIGILSLQKKNLKTINSFQEVKITELEISIETYKVSIETAKNKCAEELGIQADKYNQLLTNYEKVKESHTSQVNTYINQINKSAELIKFLKAKQSASIKEIVVKGEVDSNCSPRFILTPAEFNSASKENIKELLWGE